MSNAVATEQRQYPRLMAPNVIRAEVTLDDETREGYLVNVSLGGAFLTVEEPPEAGTSAALHIVLPWGIGECELEIETVWVQKDEDGRGIGAGISFVLPEPEARKKLEEYLARFLELSGQITS